MYQASAWRRLHANRGRATHCAVSARRSDDICSKFMAFVGNWPRRATARSNRAPKRSDVLERYWHASGDPSSRHQRQRPALVTQSSPFLSLAAVAPAHIMVRTRRNGESILETRISHNSRRAYSAPQTRVNGRMHDDQSVTAHGSSCPGAKAIRRRQSRVRAPLDMPPISTCRCRQLSPTHKRPRLPILRHSPSQPWMPAGVSSVKIKHVIDRTLRVRAAVGAIVEGSPRRCRP